MPERYYEVATACTALLALREVYGRRRPVLVSLGYYVSKTN